MATFFAVRSRGHVWAGLGLCLVVLAGSGAARAATPGSVVVKVNDIESASNPISETAFVNLGDAVAAANAAADGKTGHERQVEVLLSADQEGGGFLIEGGSSGEGLNSVTISGADKKKQKIGYAEDEVNKTRILKITNLDNYDDLLGNITESSVSLSYLSIVNGRIEAVDPGADLLGGGLYIGNEAGQGLIAKISLTEVDFEGHEIRVTGDTVGGVLAGGGGAFIDGSDRSAPQLTKGSAVTLSSVDFTGNAIRIDSAPGLDSQAIGGGIYVKNAATLNYSTGTIAGNTVTIDGGKQAAGGGMALIGLGMDTTMSIEAANLSATLKNVKFTENSVTASDATDGARGGGLYVDLSGTTGGTEKGLYSLTITSSGFDSNFADASGANTNAYGGAVFLGERVTAKITATFTSNRATSANGDAYGGAIASLADSKMEVNGSTFLENSATATDGNAMGGAIYHGGGGEAGIGTSTFRGNWASSEHGDAYGGAIAISGDGDTTISGSYFYRTENEDEDVEDLANWAYSENGDAYGGAVAVTGDGDVSISGSYFVRTADDDETEEEGLANYAHSVHGDAFGGAVAVTGSGDLTISKSVFTHNGALSDNGNAYGGAIYSASNVSLTGSSLLDNSVSAENGDASGGGLHVEGKLTLDSTRIDSNTATGVDTLGGGAYVGGSLQVNAGSQIADNTATGSQTVAGGGLYTGGGLTAADNLAIFGNTAEGGSEARGGGASLGTSGGDSISLTTGTVAIYKNTASSDGGQVLGGGLYAEGDITTTGGNLAVYENKALSQTGDVMGGGLYLGGKKAQAMSIANNRAASESGAAYGGGVYAAQDGTVIQGSVIASNTATGGSAYGGGVYSTGKLTLADTSVIDNTATSSGSDQAYGGGIYLETDGWNDVDDPLALSLVTSEGKTATISGNTADGESSGIHFGGDGNAALNITSGGVLNLLDSIRAENGGEFTMNVAGEGWFVWGGKNSFTSPGGTTLNLGGVDSTDPLAPVLTGKTYIRSDFSATITHDADLTIGGIFAFDGQRDGYESMFTFTGAGAGSLTILDGAHIDVDISSELLDGSKSYLLATGEDGYDLDLDLDGGPGEYVSSDGHVNSWVEKNSGGIWIHTNYTSLYHGLINSSDHNTKAAIDSGAMSDPFRELTAEQRALLTSSQSHFDNFTPGWLMNQTLAGLNTAISGAEAARRYGLGPVRQSAAEPGRNLRSSRLGYGNYYQDEEGRAPTGARFWSGYVGDSDRMDSNGGYYGYKSTRHGFVAGLNYDSGYFGSIGIFGGYTHTRTKSRDIVADVRSDTGHTGIIGRVSPFREIPQLSVSADLGYTFSSNKGRRGAGSLNTTSQFDQKYYTAGAEVEYRLQAGSAFVAPYISGRYVRVKQDGFSETGAMASRMGDVSGNVFISRVGASFGVDVPTPIGPVTPTANVAWRHQAGDRQFNAGASFIYTGSNTPISYTVKSAKADRDSVEIGAALRAKFNRNGDVPVGVTLGYNLNAGSNQKNHSVYVGMDLSF